MRSLLFLFVVLFSVSLKAQSQIIRSKVYLAEKQNKPAEVIPELLIKAYANGDINAYYPMDISRQVNYPQFLNHFGMTSKAYQAIGYDKPTWFCVNDLPVKVNSDVLKCMKYKFEIGERSVRNNITYQDEIKLVYVKLLYSEECSVQGLEKEGPVFRFGDIKKLKSSQYKMINPENYSMSYTMADYLLLRLFKAR